MSCHHGPWEPSTDGLSRDDEVWRYPSPRVSAVGRVAVRSIDRSIAKCSTLDAKHRAMAKRRAGWGARFWRGEKRRKQMCEHDSKWRQKSSPSSARGDQREVFPGDGRGRECGDFCYIVWRCDLDHVHADELHSTKPA